MIHEDFILTWLSHHSTGGSGDGKREEGEVQCSFFDASWPEALLPWAMYPNTCIFCEIEFLDCLSLDIFGSVLLNFFPQNAVSDDQSDFSESFYFKWRIK